MSNKPTGFVGALSSNSNAGLRKLGCRPADITHELFHSVTAGSGGGKIVRSEFFGFWSQLSLPDSPDLKTFVDRLIDQLQNVDSTMNIATVNGIPPSSIINILAFMLFCTHPHATLNPSTISIEKLLALQNTYTTGSQALVNPQQSLNATTISQTEQQAARFAQCVDNNTSLKNLMRLIAIRTLYTHPDTNISLPSSASNPVQQAQDSLDIDSVLSPLVTYASHLVHKDTRFIDWSRLPTIDSSEIQTNEYGFLYYFLTTLLAEQQKTNSSNAEVIQLSLLKAIYDKAQSLPQQIRMAAPVAEQTFLSLFHMMRAFISTQSVLNSDFLERGIRLLTPFRWTQLPFGNIAESMISMLKMEQLVPGYNRRRQVFQEVRVVNYQPSSAQPSPYKQVKPIFYIYDTLDTTSLPLLNILDLQSLQSQNLKQAAPQQGELPGSVYPPAAILAQTLVHVLDGISPQTRLSQPDVNTLQTLTQDKLLPFILKLESIEESYQSLASQGTFNFDQRETDFMKLKTDLLQAAKQSVNQPQQFQLPQHYTAMEQLPGAYQAQYPPPPLPGVEHVRVPIELKSKTSEHEGNSQPGYPAAAVFDKLHQILQSYAPLDGSIPNSTSNSKLREVRFVLVGNDRLVQHVATAYYLLRSNYPTVFAGLNVKFFLAPTTRNNLANYLAKLDLWYLRHIFTPFRSPFPFLIPWLREDETEVRPNHEGVMLGFPTVFLRESIVQYVREAQHQFKPIIYKVEARVEPGSAEPSDIIPFLQRVEIGLTPTIEEFRIKGGAAFANLRAEEIQKDKTFLYSPVDMIVKYSKVDLAGQPKPEMVDDSIPYQTILVSHVPRKGDPCTNPDPVAVGIELFAQPAKVDKAKLKKNSLYYEQRQHVAEMTCTSPIPFKIVVDGVLHGPFRSVRLTTANWKGDGKLAHFPIQTFFPVQSGL